MSHRPAAPYNPQPPVPSAIPLRICTFVFNHLHDSPPATASFSNFCIVAREWVPTLPLPAVHRCFALFAPCYLPSFHANTNCPLCNPFVLITIRIARGVATPLRARDLRFYFNSLPWYAASDHPTRMVTLGKRSESKDLSSCIGASGDSAACHQRLTVNGERPTSSLGAAPSRILPLLRNCQLSTVDC